MFSLCVSGGGEGWVAAIRKYDYYVEHNIIDVYELKCLLQM